MSKRLMRVFAPEIADTLQNLINKEVNVVLRSGTTVFGYLVSGTSESLEVQDLRRHLHVIPMETIEEVLYDQSSKVA